MPPLTETDKLDQMSQTHAEQLADQNSFRHSINKGVGENLASSWSSKPPNLKDCASNLKFIIHTKLLIQLCHNNK